jgi:hypothetical protein
VEKEMGSWEEKEGTKAVEMLVKMHYPCTFEEVS